MLYRAWKCGHDVWALYHRLGPDRRPAADPDAPMVTPAYPMRLQALLYACAQMAGEEEAAMFKAMAGRP